VSAGGPAEGEGMGWGLTGQVKGAVGRAGQLVVVHVDELRAEQIAQ